MKLFERIVGWWRSHEIVDFRMERYLARSIDIADLERRQRRWDAMSEAERNGWCG